MAKLRHGNSTMAGPDDTSNHMDVNIDEPGVKRSLVESIKRNTRQSHYKLHQHFFKYATVEEGKNNKPDSCLDKHNWEELCDHFASDKYKHRSEVNKNNRKKVQCKQSNGRKAFTVRSHEISKIPGEPCGRIDLYESTHCSRKDEWMSVEAKNNWVIMLKKREEYTELGIEKFEDEIVFEVLGHGTGYTKGLGYGPMPPSRLNSLYNSSSQYKDELNDKEEELQQSKAQVQELKTQVTELKEALSAQNADL
ncbi:hypothetical protein OROMI_004284 [Orobanche minor]